MVATRESLDRFHQFALQQIEASDSSLSFDEVYEQWRIEHPSQEEFDADARAIQESLRDMENGETGRDFEEFMSDFRKRNRLSE